MTQWLETQGFQLPAQKGYRQANHRTSPKNQKKQKFPQTSCNRNKTPCFPKQSQPVLAERTASTPIFPQVMGRLTRQPKCYRHVGTEMHSEKTVRKQDCPPRPALQAIDHPCCIDMVRRCSVNWPSGWNQTATGSLYLI